MSNVLFFVLLRPMPTLTVELLNPKARTILDGLADTGLIAIDAPPKQWGTHSIMELKGLGAELWKDESADEYLRKVRESSMETAAEHLYADYTTDENLTAFTQLDCEDFYEAPSPKIVL